jgi:hypothetical protein
MKVELFTCGIQGSPGEDEKPTVSFPPLPTDA